MAEPTNQVPLARDRRLVPILLVGFGLILAGMLWWVATLAGDLSDLRGRVRVEACELYGAPLDLSGMAGLCHDVGYQQTTRFAP